KKPFSLEELIVRINNQYKLSNNKIDQQSANPTKSYKLGEFLYYPIKLELQHATQNFKISNREAEVLNELCLNRNTVIDRRELMNKIWQDDSYFISRNLDVYINKIDQQSANPTKSYKLGEFLYYPIKLELQHATQNFKISNREAEVLNELCLNRNTVIDRRELMNKIWQDDSYFISRNLDVYINK